MSDFTPEQVERAAEALWAIARVHGSSYSKSWEALHECAQRRYRREALTVLSAAGAPEVTEDMVLRGALVLDPEAFADPLVAYGEGAARQSRGDALVQSREVLCAALGQSGAPEKVAPVVDEAALERLIMGRTATAAARAVAAYLRGESK